jgi:hypothetical protein
MKMFYGNDPLNDQWALQGLYLVIVTLSLGVVWIIYNHYWWLLLPDIALALALTSLAIKARNQFKAIYGKVDVQILSMRENGMVGPDWLFWSVSLLLFAGVAIGARTNVLGLMCLAFFLKSNGERLQRAFCFFCPSSKINNSRFASRLPDIVYGTLMVVAIMVVVLATVFHFNTPPTGPLFEVGIGAIGLALALSLFNNIYYGRRLPR